MRHDLLSLTEDDLITQSNRGIVNRQAKKDLEKLTYDISEDENGIVTVEWSNGETVTLPPDKTLLEVSREANPVAQNVSRQVVRSVLAYQIWAEEQHDPDSSKPLISIEAWNPGDIPDDALIGHFGKAKITRTQTDYDKGHVIELVRSIKPTARIHTLSCTVRFLVSGDFRYTHCDCEEAAPCSHVPMAVWAFRQLAEGQDSAIIESQKDDLTVPETLFSDLETAMLDFSELGLSGATDALLRRIKRLSERCDNDGLIWMGEILRDLLTVAKQYTAHDAQFAPIRLAELLGELFIRMQAIRAQPDAIPALFVRGSQADRETKVGSSTLVGLGCGVDMHQKGATLSAYLQDTNSGQVFAVQKYYADPDNKKDPRKFWQLSDNKAMKGIAFEKVGSHRMLIKGGKRLASAVFSPGRSQASANPQNYKWENLRAPLLAEDFAEIFARRMTQPPASLRPRRIGEDFFVCPVNQVEHATFDTYSQSVFAVLNDITGAQATLIHPYTARGAEGTEKLLWWLNHHPQDMRYVAGHVEVNRGGLVFRPVAVIFEVNGTRHMIQPWVDRFTEPTADAEKLPDAQDGGILRTDPVFYFPSQVADVVGDLLLNGLSRVDDALIRRWEHVVNEGQQLGFDGLLRPLEQFGKRLAAKRNTVNWDWRESAQQLFDIALLIQFAREQASATE